MFFIILLYYHSYCITSIFVHISSIHSTAIYFDALSFMHRGHRGRQCARRKDLDSILLQLEYWSQRLDPRLKTIHHLFRCWYVWPFNTNDSRMVHALVDFIRHFITIIRYFFLTMGNFLRKNVENNQVSHLLKSAV